MRPIIAPLKLADQGPNVANLQDALVLLIDRAIIPLSPAEAQSFKNLLSQERQDQTYKDVTSKAVVLFQQQHHLPFTGEVDPSTAAALNQILRGLGAFDTAGSGQRRIVAGQVVEEDSTPFAGTVILFEKNQQGSVRLGEDATDPEGHYTISYDPSLAPEDVSLRVAAFDPGGGLRADTTFQTVKPLEIINLTVSAVPPSYAIRGRVSSRASAGVGGLRVQIVDRRVGSEAQLVEVSTAEDGSYQAAFHYAGPKQRPDLQIRVLSGDTLTGSSEVRYNASDVEILNVELRDEVAAQLTSEHESLIGDLTAHVQGRLGDLQETDGRGDITYLANKTGWDARAVALAALSDQFSLRATGADGSAVDPAFFYALFRAGLPTNEDLLYQIDTGTVQKVWERAAEQGVIPPTLVSEIPAALERFQRLVAEKLLSAPALVGVSSLQAMLSASRLEPAQQGQFAALYAAHRTDMPQFWEAITDAFGEETANRLQLDGKLNAMAYNNARLVQAIHATTGDSELRDPLQLAQQGFFRAGRWSELLAPDIPIPEQIPGDGPDEQRANYADYLAAQLRLSYPTAAVAHMVKSGDLPLTGAAPSTPDQVHDFLTQHQGRFEIGVQPVEQYLARNHLGDQVAASVIEAVKRLQRVYQLTPSDQAMSGLMQHGMDAAYHVVRHDRDTFVRTYGQELGGTDSATQVYDRAVQVHGAVLNVVVGYVTAKNGIGLGGQRLQAAQQGQDGSGQILHPAPRGPSAAPADVIAYPTLEGLFGSMDFCACEDCRTVLSPAAYLVDLLHFIDQQHPPAGTENPQAVLLDRRPDLQHLPLSCENTNTALPYIDVVNETLEYFIANDAQQLSLKGYAGHDTGDAASADLLASPRFVMDAAYIALRGERFPAPLPFHQPLESLRRYFSSSQLPLALAMERLRTSDDLERGANPYGWRDILIEEVGLSRAEHEILTDSTAVPLWRLYGFPSGTAENDVIAALSNAKDYTRRVGITYEELVTILQTRFANPNGDLVPKLERLGVSFATLKALKEGTITGDDFDALLPQGAAAPNPSEYGGDIKAWVTDDTNFGRIMSLITLNDPTGDAGSCDFDTLELRFARPMTDPNDTTTRLRPAEFVRILRLIRLWKKTGWTLQQTDDAVCALYRSDLAPLGPEDVDTVAELDTGFLTLLPRIGIVVRVMRALDLTPDRDLLPLLTCWAQMGSHGPQALYRQLFLNPALLRQDAVFADNGFGEFLTDPAEQLAGHAEALRSACNLTGDEYDRIVAELGYDETTQLTIANISEIFRRGWLARALRISVRELLLFVRLTGLDPFAAPDPTDPAILRLVRLVQALRARSLRSAAALYLIWNQDLSGRSAPDHTQQIEFAHTLRRDFAAIEDEFAAPDPGGDTIRASMALVYGQEAADAFVELLDDTRSLDVPYTHPMPTLEAEITAVDPRIAYDDFRHRLSHTGLLTSTTRDALKNLAGVTATFQAAVDALFAMGEDAKGSFMALHPELQPLYETYISSTDPVDKRRNALLAAFKPELGRRRMRQQALQRLSAATAVDPSFTQILMDGPAPPYPLHTAGDSQQPALNDLLAMATQGLAVSFFFRDNATGTPDTTIAAASKLEYGPGGANPLASNPTADAAVSGTWTGKIEAPETGFHNLVVEADPGATIKLALGGQDRPLARTGTIWHNAEPLELKAGALYDLTVVVEKVKDTLKIQWETPNRPREVIPPRYLYPPSLFEPFLATHTRFLKAAALAEALHLTAAELAHFATDPDYEVLGEGWLNALPLSGDPAHDSAVALLRPLEALLDYARIKTELPSGDAGLLGLLQDPVAAAAGPEGPLFALTGWDRVSLDDLLAHYGDEVADLAHFDRFRRVHEAFASIRAMGIPASALLEVTTNDPDSDPDSDTVRALQAAVRARYDAADWRDLIQPLNNELRALQRDALVAYILHKLGSDPATSHIDTPDKLFEFFLMDVQMEACMQTSRIRHALSTVQLFIERCLMNLEPRVSSAAINAKQWEWMKRYRVWEANRKVFLWPENWLEPELRDDKSPLFKEAESELLQSDITEDSATAAFLNYLSKLDEIAKLEPCGIYHAAGDPSRGTSEVYHVVARTAGAHRKHYYRRYEFGSWTPWEQVKLDIEDTPLAPVVWHDRLLLFWLRILKQAPQDAQKPFSRDDTLISLRTTDLKTGLPDVSVNAVLCWSEYFNGTWSPTRTSDLNHPAEIAQTASTGDGAFDRSKLRLSVKEEDDTLRIRLRGQGVGSFVLYNTHSLPVVSDFPLSPGSMFERSRIIDSSGSELEIRYNKGDGHFGPAGYVPATILPRKVLQNGLGSHVAEPAETMGDPWLAPFFYEDARQVFLVTTAEQPVWVREHPDYGVGSNPVIQDMQIPPLVFQPPEPARTRPELLGVSGTLGPDPGVVDPAPLQLFVTEDAYIRRSIGTTGGVVYGNKQIGPSGAVSADDATN